MTWYKLLIGALAILGGGAWYLIKKKIPLSYESFCEECIDKANLDIANYSSQDVVKTIVVLTSTNSKDVEPYIYRRFSNGTVKKKLINTVSFPFDLCPEEVKESIKNGEYVLKTI